MYFEKAIPWHKNENIQSVTYIHPKAFSSKGTLFFVLLMSRSQKKSHVVVGFTLVMAQSFSIDLFLAQNGAELKVFCVKNLLHFVAIFLAILQKSCFQI